MATTSITETPNELTQNLDLASPDEIVRLLRQVDAQLFAGWGGLQGILDEEMLKRMAEAMTAASNCMAAGGAIVMSGSGTSGRFAFFVARAMNSLLQRYKIHGAKFYYLCAGEDEALFASREAPEDDFARGADRLRAIVDELPVGTPAMFVGITCGFSAPFVAGQLDLCLQQPYASKVLAVLLGFNPLHLARKNAIEGWDKSFADVAHALSTAPNGLIVNPAVGPEAVTGSTRMKGGSATKIILEVMFQTALAKYLARREGDRAAAAEPVETATAPAQRLIGPVTAHDVDTLRRALMACYRCVTETYMSAAAIARGLDAAGKCLSGANGHLYYLGRGSYGIKALIDASECPPTYNAWFSDVRAFIDAGYSLLANDQGDLSHLGEDFLLAWSDFDKVFAPRLTSQDTIFVLDGSGNPETLDTGSQQVLASILAKAQKAGCTLGRIVTADHPERYLSTTWPSDAKPTIDIQVRLSSISTEVMCALSSADSSQRRSQWCNLAELSMKLVLNAITTGAHVLKGKVLQNRMIDLQVSNNKLFYRAINIVSAFSGVEFEPAKMALLRAIYGVDTVTREILGADVSSHIRKATSRAVAEGLRVVPLAIVLAHKPTETVLSAQHHLDRHPVVRQALNDLKVA